MRAVHLLALGAGVAAFAAPALANDSVMKGIANPAEQVLQTVDYANTRYSKLDQINASNVKNSRSPGPSRPACCAATRARPSSSAT